MAKNEKKNAEKELEQVSGGIGIGQISAFELAQKRARDQYNVENARKEPKHELGPQVQAMVNHLEGK